MIDRFGGLRIFSRDEATSVSVGPSVGPSIGLVSAVDLSDFGRVLVKQRKRKD